MSEEQRDKLVETIIRGLPGRTTEQYTLETFGKALSLYDGIDDATARKNLRRFIREVAPVAEEVGLLLAIHPDDPPFRELFIDKLNYRHLAICRQIPRNAVTVIKVLSSTRL